MRNLHAKLYQIKSILHNPFSVLFIGQVSYKKQVALIQ